VNLNSVVTGLLAKFDVKFPWELLSRGKTLIEQPQVSRARDFRRKPPALTLLEIVLCDGFEIQVFFGSDIRHVPENVAQLFCDPFLEYLIRIALQPDQVREPLSLRRSRLSGSTEHGRSSPPQADTLEVSSPDSLSDFAIRSLSPHFGGYQYSMTVSVARNFCLILVRPELPVISG